MALREGAKTARKPKADLRPNEKRNESIAIFSPQFGGGARAGCHVIELSPSARAARLARRSEHALSSPTHVYLLLGIGESDAQQPWQGERYLYF